MHVLMVTDAYPPLRTSCAVQMYDLGQAFIEQGHQVSIITPSYGLQEKIKIEIRDGVRLVQVRAFQTKDINYVYRTFAEFINPFLIWHKLKKCPEFLNAQYDGIIWYSPTIFWGPLIKSLKQQYEIKAYLILRDIFPDWALDLGLIKKGIIYRFLKAVEVYQYKQADMIGVQSPNNLEFCEKNKLSSSSKLEVLWNWVGNRNHKNCSIELKTSALAGKKIFIYAGNIGVAQGVENLILLVEELQKFPEAGMVFLGRGSEVGKLKSLIRKRKFQNVLFFTEIPSDEVYGVLKQCTYGLVTLDRGHTHHNIPGKFLSYLNAKLPVLAILNEGNDLVRIIQQHQIGEVCVDPTKDQLSMLIQKILNQCPSSEHMDIECRKLLQELFSTQKAVNKITTALKTVSL